MNRLKPTPMRFDDLPDAAMIQIRPLIDFKVVPHSATTIWRKCRSGEFPSPIKISPGITAWRVGDIRKYLEKLSSPSSGTPSYKTLAVMNISAMPHGATPNMGLAHGRPEAQNSSKAEPAHSKIMATVVKATETIQRGAVRIKPGVKRTPSPIASTGKEAA
jgi:prophage regulatory protein